jgi:uncharacterized membrane protein
MADENTGEGVFLTKGRLEGLSDGIFAFAMTLLVVGLDLPEKSTIVQSTGYATDLLVSLQSDFLHYILAFLILGAFWLSHHTQLNSVKRIDKVYIWINLSVLLLVALLPFTTSFSGDFPKVPLGAIVFEASLFAIGIAMFCHWTYATRGHRLVDPALDNRYIRYVGISNLVVPFVSVVGIIIALSGNTWSTAIYLTLPFVGYAVYRLAR